MISLNAGLLMKCKKPIIAKLVLSLLCSNFTSLVFGQETNSRASGRVFSDSNEIASRITVSVIHEPTQNKYVDIIRNDGYFHFFNLKPGGPYTIILSSAGYDTLKKTNLFSHLTGEYFFIGDTEITEFFLQKKIISLDEVVIDASNANRNKSGVETNINGFTLGAMPTINRNFQDLVRLVPQAKVTGDGVMSLAGQNNRFNAFFIDGANNNDIQGISVNGMNNGQTGSPPISIEAIEELNVLLAPYDVQYGTFTGGSINAITRSGSNENKSSVWYYFRNQNLAGRSPNPLPKPGTNGELYRPRLSSFFNQTFGIWNSGALIKNKLFYFALLEKQSETRPQPYDFRIYQGTSKEQDILALSGFLKDTYKYDPGSFIETKDVLEATRMILKLDWNQSLKNKLTLSYRYNQAERSFPPRVSSYNSIVFENSGIKLPGTTHSASFEWKRFFKRNMNNRLLLTFTNQISNRKWKGKAFPLVTIRDGNGSISFGSEANSGNNDLNANDLTLFNVFKYVRKKQVYTLGADINYTTLDNRNPAFYFGAYTFANLSSFINGASPSRLQRSYYLSNEKYNPAKFHALRTSIFINDEIRARSNLKLNFGLRLDVNSITSMPQENEFFNSNGIHLISDHYNLDGAVSGKSMKPHWAVSPRIGIEHTRPKAKINIKAGAGVFVGHIVNIWHHDVFNNNIGSLDTKPLQFIADPYNQPDSNLQDLNLIARRFKYPSVFRSSLIVQKKLWKSWAFSIEGIFTKNIQEVSFKNVNILPPTRSSELPDSRNIYSTTAAPPFPVLNSFGTVYLLTNNHNKKGHSYSISLIVQKQAKNFSFNSSYTYGRSWVLFEITGTQTPLRSQWSNMETVNGRNYNILSTSDNDLKHRITAWVSKKFKYRKGKTATTVSLFYNGQSGIPYSYVYFNSMINDNGWQGQNFDLIYIPTEPDLATMNFKPIENTITNQVEYSPQQQKKFLNAFIENDKYLRKHRGEFAERNGARLPFTHVFDLRLQQDFMIKIKGKSIGIAITYDVFNLANMLNKNWGHIYFLLNDSYPLITFVDYSSTIPVIVPRYQFKPFTGKPYSLQQSTIPGNSARWISQLGIKINLN